MEIYFLLIALLSGPLLDKSFASLAIFYTTSTGFIRLRTSNPPDHIVSNSNVESFILADGSFATIWRLFETCLLVKNS